MKKPAITLIKSLGSLVGADIPSDFFQAVRAERFEKAAKVMIGTIQDEDCESEVRLFLKSDSQYVYELAHWVDQVLDEIDRDARTEAKARLLCAAARGRIERDAYLRCSMMLRLAHPLAIEHFRTYVEGDGSIGAVEAAQLASAGFGTGNVGFPPTALTPEGIAIAEHVYGKDPRFYNDPGMHGM